MTFDIDHDPRWVPVLGLEARTVDGAPPPLLPVGSDSVRELMLAAGAAAGFVLADGADPAGPPAAWATVHVEDVPACTVAALVEGFCAVPTAISASTVEHVETGLGPATRLQHDRVHSLPVVGSTSPSTVVLTHALWLWQVVDDGEEVVVALGTEIPAPHPAGEVLPQFDDLAGGFRRRPDLS